MSSNEGREGIRLIWKIENFNCKTGKCLQSPSFGPDSPMWAVRVINESSNFISVELLQLMPARYVFNCSFAILDWDATPLVWKEKKNNDSENSIYFNHFIEMDMLRSKKNKFLFNGILTVQCLIWKTDHELLTPVSLFARTRIQPHPIVLVKTFTWNFGNVIDFGIRWPVQYLKCSDNGDNLSIKLTLNSDDEFVLILAASIFRIDLNIRLSVIDVTGKKIQFAKRDCNFERKHQIRTFNTNITKAMLMFYQNLFLPKNTLTFQLTCTFLRNVTLNCMVDENEIISNFPRITADASKNSEAPVISNELEINQPTELHPHNTVNQALQDMFNDGFLSDFNLRVGDRVFSVHRSILGMRSRFFRAMFTTETKGNEDNWADIQDVDEDTLYRFLQFVYSDRLDEDMGYEKASSLYAAADKYALDPLKQRCSTVLQSGLCVSSVLEVLSMADKYQDQDLKSAALDFISLNDQDIIGTKKWIEFEEENAKLAVETCRKLYLKKMNG